MTEFNWSGVPFQEFEEIIRHNIPTNPDSTGFVDPKFGLVGVAARDVVRWLDIKSKLYVDPHNRGLKTDIKHLKKTRVCFHETRKLLTSVTGYAKATCLLQIHFKIRIECYRCLRLISDPRQYLLRKS